MKRKDTQNQTTQGQRPIPRPKDYKTEELYIEAVKASGWPYTDAEQYNTVQWPGDIKLKLDGLLASYYTPYNRKMPGHVIKAFYDCIDTSGTARDIAISDAISKAEMDFLTAKIYGWIRVPEDVVPMPEDVKARLKALNEERRKERAESHKYEIKKEKVIKLPVFSDQQKQKELKLKYPWASLFKPDPDKSGATLVDIKCIKCSGSRTVHLSDLFQVKKCLACK